MPTLAEKKQIVEEIQSNLEKSSAVYVTDYNGMSVPLLNELRSEFNKENVYFKIYKNTLFQRAVDEVDGYDVLEQHLHNQNAFAFVDEELAIPAKILKKFIKENEKPVFKAAIIDGDYYNGEKLDTLAAMKSKDEILGDILGLLMAPVSNIVGALQAQGSTLAGAVQTIAEKDSE